MASTGTILAALQRAVTELAAGGAAANDAAAGAGTVQSRSAATGFHGIAARMGQVNERLLQLQTRHAQLTATTKKAAESVHGAIDNATPDGVVAALAPVLDAVDSALTNAAAIIAEVDSTTTEAEDALRGGQPAKLIGLLHQVRRALVRTVEALGEAQQQTSGAIAAARHLGDATGTAAAGGGPSALERGRHYVRTDGRVVRNRVITADGLPVERLAWDDAAGAYVEVATVVPARYRPPMTTFTDVSPEHQSRLDQAQEMRDRARRIRDGLTDTDDPVLVDDRARYLSAARSTVTTTAEVMGSLAGDAYIEAAYANRDAPPEKLHEGTGSGTLDQVWAVTVVGLDGAPDARHVVVECKGGASSLGTRQIGAQDYQQGTVEYLDDILATMERRGTPEEARLALRVRRSLSLGRLDYVHVHAVPQPGGKTRVRAGTFDLSPRPKPRGGDAPDQAGS